MRVLHVQKTDGLGGCERQLLSLLPALAQRGVDVRMYVLGAGRFRRFVDPLRALGIPVGVTRAGSHLNPRLVPSILGEIRRFRPDVVHTHLIHGDIYGQTAARLGGVPGVSSIHSTDRRHLRDPYRSGARLAGHVARRTIAISHHVARFLAGADLVPSERIRVVHYGLSISEWTLSSEARGPARAEMGFGPDDVVVGIASRIIAGKGHTFLIDALAKAAPQAPKLRLAVAGDGPLASEVMAYARSALADESYQFLGFVPDMRGFMEATDVVVFPTSPALGEGFGLAALEAMAAARPVVATRVGSLPELVLDGETGYLVDPLDPQELTDRLIDLAEDIHLRRRLGNAGRERAVGEFPLEKSVDGVLSVYEEVG